MSENSSTKKTDTEQVNLRMSTKLLTRLDNISEQMFGLKRSQLIHRAVEEFVLRQEQLIAQAQAQKQPSRRQ